MSTTDWDHSVNGLDTSLQELTQANNTKSDTAQIYVYGDILTSNIFPRNCLDFVIINSTYQYFQTFSQVFDSLKPYLKSKFEIHLLDTMFYQEEEIQNAKKRTQEYYTKQQAKVMIDLYFHHSLEELKFFQYEILYNPNSRFNSLKRIIALTSPFHWIKVTGMM